MVATADTLGVFQLCKGGMRRMLRQLRANHFGDMVAAAAMYRPGPIKSGMVQDYIDRKHGRKPVAYLHPALEAATGRTYGTWIFQEQIMQAARSLAGYTLGQADVLRKAMGKKKKEVMDAQRAKFIDGCATTGSCDPTKATQLFDMIAEWAGYGFNESHATCYAMLSYRCAWAKVHYPAEFYAAWLSTLAEEADPSRKISEAVYDARAHGVEVLPPDINRSGVDFVVE